MEVYNIQVSPHGSWCKYPDGIQHIQQVFSESSISLMHRMSTFPFPPSLNRTFITDPAHSFCPAVKRKLNHAYEENVILKIEPSVKDRMSPIKHLCLFRTSEIVKNFGFTRGDIVTFPLSIATCPTKPGEKHIRIVPLALL